MHPFDPNLIISTTGWIAMTFWSRQSWFPNEDNGFGDILTFPHVPLSNHKTRNLFLSVCDQHNSRIVHLINFTLGRFVAEHQVKCSLEIGAIWICLSKQPAPLCTAAGS